jgi:hypothetical protein
MTEELEVLHIGDFGTVFELTVVDQDNEVVDVSAATEMTWRFRKPGGTTFTKTGSHVTDGTDGKVKYVVEELAEGAILDVAGTWSYQLFVDLPSGEWSSDVLHFDVEGNL